MQLIYHIAIILTIYITHGDSSLFSRLKDSVSNFLHHTSYQKNKYEDSAEENLRFQVRNYDGSFQENNRKVFQSIRDKERVRDGPFLQDKNDAQRNQKWKVFGRGKTEKLRVERIPKIDEENKMETHFRMDPVLNFIVRRSGKNLRRRGDMLTSSASSSSSLEMKEWKNEWKEHWINKKLEALNATGHPKGDVINMVAARPWGVPCGDPDQHDMPWGSCMLPMECDPEFRIFRGDYFCGRTQFICCAVQLTNYDMYQGFDVSFADSALTTSSDERKNKGKNSRERRRRKRRRARNKRKKQRAKRKRKIKKNIRKIVREMRKILNRSYRNGTTERKRKTKQLKKFIKELKNKYRKDRNVVSVIHEKDLLNIDDALMKRLNEIKGVNANFMKNSTFRDVVVNGTLNRQAVRMLVEAYPELSANFKDGRRGSPHKHGKDYLDYDIEYGMLYY